MQTPFADITVAVDPSPASQSGVEYALGLARRGARVHFCSVVDASEAFAGSAMGAAIDPAPMIAAMESGSHLACQTALAAARRAGVLADTKVLSGPIAASIADYALACKSDALVIGTNARHGLSLAILGSIAERLMQTSAIPIVVTHVGDALTQHGPVTAAVDGSAAAGVALRVAIDVARARAASLSIVTVVDAQAPDWEAARSILDAAAEIVRAAGVDFDLVTLPGRAAETIVESARRKASPIIVMGTTGRSGLARFAFGSVAAGVVERAHVPVIVVHEPTAAAGQHKSQVTYAGA